MKSSGNLPRRDGTGSWLESRPKAVILEILKVFYTSLYHSFLAPVLYSDSDGRYRGADGEVYIAEGLQIIQYSHYGTLSGLHTLFILYCNPTGFLI
ncbi:MAG: glycoside hydrolase family 92 protein [Bacteroidales bacterium]